MDAYNRGYDPAIASLGGINSKIGNAVLVSQSDTISGSASVSAGFYAAAYSYNGGTIISYRGTDNTSPLPGGSGNDMWNGYWTGLGLAGDRQSDMAVATGKAVIENCELDIAAGFGGFAVVDNNAGSRAWH